MCALCGATSVKTRRCGDPSICVIRVRSSHLKHLRLVSCYDVSDRGLSVAASKLLFLEDLEISYCSITRDALETVGRCCPHLRSLKFNIPGCRHYIGSDDEALAIAQSMPELRHLQLFGNKLTNDGLKSILDGCPHLESLDLRQCFNVSLQGDLEKRCVEQIKNLRRPSDSTRDYEFDAQVYGSDYPSEISDIDLYDDYDDYFELSGASDFSDYDEEYSFFD
ncbi:hypothetical protein PTKIN_Ptkin07bG0025700 [Pterospermum kingtungense]